MRATISHDAHPTGGGQISPAGDGSPTPSRRRPSALRRVGRMVRSRSRKLGNRLLGVYDERFLGRGSGALPHAPIFIVGAPRSGSTLLYQLMTQRFDVGFLANRHSEWYGSPALIERRARRRRANAATGAAAADAAAFRSEYGATEGADAPSECGEFWYRFFPRRPHEVHVDDMPAGDVRRMRAAMRAFTRACGAPVVVKNLYCSLRLGPIHRAMPEALFIVIRRDVVDNAQSLLVGRKRVTGSYDNWWSAEPANVDALRALPPEEQVVAQIRAIDAAINVQRGIIGTDRFIDVAYEDLCDDAPATLERIAAFVAGHGTDLGMRAEIPTSFPRNAKISIDADMHERLVAHAR